MNKMKWMVASLAAAIFLSGAPVPLVAAVIGAPRSKTPVFRPGEVIVKFRSSAAKSSSAISRLNSRYRVADMKEVKVAAPKAGAAPALLKAKNRMSNIYKLKVTAGTDIERIAKEYRQSPDVEYAEPDYQCFPNLTPNDPGLSQQWGVSKIQAQSAWNLNTGANSVIVAIVDTGVDYNHPDLKANIWTNPGEIPNNGIDDDGNGYPDDVRGWDFSESDNDPKDGYGHGTHVAGIVSAVGNNGIGVAGVSWKNKLMIVKGFLNDGSGGYNSILAEGIIYAVDNGARVINNSWGGYGKSQFLEDAVNYAVEHGAVVICSAGNDSVSLQSYPAGFANSVAVAATDPNDHRASFSNFGYWVSVAAPGLDIYSTMPTYQNYISQNYGIPLNYGNLSGTSMASPFVAGVAALVISQFPYLSSAQVKERLMFYGVDGFNTPPALPIGTGRTNAYVAITQPANPIPANVSISGYIRDANGQGVAGATMTVAGPAILKTYVTKADGFYEITNLRAGPYNLEPLKDGYKFYPPKIEHSNLTGPTPNQNFKGEKWWDVEVVDISGSANAMKIDKQGRPRMAYNGIGGLRYAAWTGSQWTIEVVPQTRPDDFALLSFGLDGSDKPGIAFVEYKFINDVLFYDLKYAYWNGSSWSVELVDTQSYLNRVWLQFGPDNRPHLLYFDEDTLSMKYAVRGSNGWNIQTVVSGPGVGGAFSFAVDAAGSAHIAHHDYVNTDVKYTRWTGSQWVSEIVDTNPYQSSNPSLALDPSGNPEIAYTSKGGHAAMHAKRGSSGWNIQVVDEHIKDGRVQCQIAVDKNGAAHIVYKAGYYIEESVYAYSIKYARSMGSEWLTTEVDNENDFGINDLQFDIFNWPAIALDPAGTPHLSYVSYHAQHSAYPVVKHAKFNYTSPNSFSIGGVIKIVGSAKEGIRVDLTGDQSRTAYTNTAGYYEFTNLPKGNYTVTPASYQLFYTVYYPKKRTYAPLDFYSRLNQDFTGAEPYVYGLVKDTLGNPVVGATATLAGVTYQESRPTEFDGSFILYPTMAGSFALTAEKAGYRMTPDRYYYPIIDEPKYNEHFTAQKVWDVKTVDALGNVGVQPSMKLASNGMPRLAYYDATNQNLKYAAWGGTSWGISILDSVGDVGQYPSIALNSVGYPEVAYYDATNANLKLIKFNGASWVYSLLDSVGDVGRHAALALDGKNYEHIAYYDATNKDLKCADWRGTAWFVKTVDASNDSGMGASIAVDKSSMSHIAYWSGNGTDYVLKYAKWDGYTGAVLAQQTVDSVTSTSTFVTSIALDAEGRPRISYYSIADKALRYAKWNGIVWTSEKVDAVGEVSQATAAVSSLSLDSNGNAHISYYSHSTQDMKVAEWTGTSWSTQTIDGFGSVGLYSSLVLDPNGATRIVYYDAQSRQLKHALNIVPLNLAIRGFVKDSNNQAIAGATVTLSGASNATVKTGSDGSYEFLNLSSKTYSVTAQMFGYALTPAARPYSPLNAIQDEENFIGSPSMFVRGTVKDTSGTPIKDAIVNLYGNKSTVTFITDTDGKYQFLNLAPEKYRVIASKMDYGFSPMLKNIAYLPQQGIGTAWNDNQDITGANIGRLVDAFGKIIDSAVAVSTDGIVHVAYIGNPEQGSTGKWVKYARLIDGVWTIETVFTTTNNSPLQNVGMAVDSKGQPHIVFAVSAGGKYAKRNGTGWTVEGIYTSGQIAGNISIALDKEDKPHMAYAASYSGSYVLEYVRWIGIPGLGWMQSTIEAPVTNTSFGQQLSLALDKSDNPHIAYMVWVNASTSYLKYAKFNGTAWLKYVIDASATNIGWYPSLALDKNNNAAISYFVMPVNALSLKLAKFNGAAWAIQSVDATALMGTHTVKWGESGHPQIAYSGKEGLKHARWDGVKWIYKVLDNSNTIASNMALDPYDLHPHMAYLDKVSQDVRYVKYITTVSATGFFAKGYVPGSDKIIKTFAVNENGLVAAETGPAVDPLNGAPLAGVDINLGVEAGVFSGAASLTAIETTPEPSQKVTIKPTALAFVLQSDSLQPSRLFTISISNFSSFIGEPSSQEAMRTTLAVGQYDPANGRWIVLPSRTEVNSVIAAASSLGIFALLQLSPTLDLSNVIVYPNPYKSGSREYGGNAITFSGLTQSAHIKVFNIAGELVSELDKNDTSDRLAWDMTNTDREKLASGVYIYYITNPASADQKAKGRFSIIK